MALTIQHREAEQLARVLAERTGQSIEQAVINALRESLAREPEPRPVRQQSALMAIGRACATLPDHDTRSADEVLGYDQDGVPR